MQETCLTCGAKIDSDVTIAHATRTTRYTCGAAIVWSRATGGWQFYERQAPCGNPPAQADMAIRTGSALGLPTISAS